jgi:hypothetical protein
MRVMFLALVVLVASVGLAEGEGPARAERDAPEIWRVFPPDECFSVVEGDYVLFQAGASDGDCDLQCFVWGDWVDPVEGCEAESGYGLTFDTVPGVYVLPVSVYDWAGNSASMTWRVEVSSPVTASSWGRIKALYR